MSRWEATWRDVISVYRKSETAMQAERKVTAKHKRGGTGNGERYRVWSAIVDLIIAIVEWVGVTPEMEDDVFDMLFPYVDRKEGAVRECLEGLNPDELWYLEERERVQKGEGEDWDKLKPEDREGWVFRDVKFV